MEKEKKISFGFSKVTKKPNLLPVKLEPKNQVELIKCLEGQEIKLVEERKDVAPIVIPMKENGKTSAALASLIKRRAVLLGEEEEAVSKPKIIEVTDSTSNDDLEKRAAQEILADLQKSNETVRDSGLVLPIVNPDELPLDGAKESNMDDYESIPIEQYGLAMLRGMGWVEPPPAQQKKFADEGPMVRPKGMGLGADKALKAKPLLVQPEANETLEVKKLAYVRILGGKYKDAYGQIEGFDDEAGRVIVKLALGGAREAFNEFLCQPVSKKEFTQYGKCINTAKYEEYKKLENEHGQIIVKKEEKVFKAEADAKNKFIDSNDSKAKASSRQRHDECPGSSSNRGRTRSRSHSGSRSQKHKSSNRRHDDEAYSDDNSGSSTNESDTDSAYERRRKHNAKTKSKSKSHTRKSKSSKKKSRRHRSNSENSSHRTYDDDSFSDESDDERQRRHSNKKNKKKTKKSKKQRSRTPSRHRR